MAADIHFPLYKYIYSPQGDLVASHWVCSPNGLGSRPLVDIFRPQASTRDLPCSMMENSQGGATGPVGLVGGSRSLSVLWAPDTLTDFTHIHTYIYL